MFMLAACVLLIRGLRLKSGKAVPVTLSALLLLLQGVQLTGISIEGLFKFSMPEHLFLSGIIVLTTLVDLARRKRVEFI
ncbi:MAG: hypothetical protein KG003_00815 [Bacteroidetes bacterium]|nr:hypothetical protein [Bacteroidota bacterium]